MSCLNKNGSGRKKGDKMKIKELHIYGYGKFADKKISFSDHGIQVIYGLNEAGKSTLMSFIHSMLFGFPVKQHPDKRFEPKAGGKYGGALIIECEIYGTVKVERVKGRAAAGDVTLYFQDGRTGGDKELAEILKGTDRPTYQAIFSFDLFGLQKVYELNREKLGKYLFLTSVFGSDQLYRLEEKLQREQEDLFKPNGRKPLLNRSLNELMEDFAELQHAKEQQRAYNFLIKERDSLEKQLKDCQNEKVTLKTERKKVEKQIAVLPLLERRKECLQLLKDFPDGIQFPEDGFVRLEKLSARRDEVLEQLGRVQEKEKGIEDSLSALKIDGRPADETIFEELKSQFPLIQKQLEEQKLFIVQQQMLEGQIHEELIYIFGHQDENAIKKIDTSVRMKEKIKDAAKKYEQLFQRKKLLDEQYERAQYSLEECERRIKEYESFLLDPSERERLIEEQSAIEQEMAQTADKHYLKEQIAQLKAKINEREKKNREKLKKWKILTVSLLSVFAFAIVLSFVYKNWLFLTAFLPFIIVFFFFRPQDDELLKHLQNEHEQLVKKLDKQNDSRILERTLRLKHIKEILWKDQQVRQKIEIEKMNYKGKEQAYERILSLYDEWEHEKYQLQHLIFPFYEHFQLPKEAEGSQLLEQFERIASCQKLIREKRMLEEKVRLYEENLNQFRKKFEPLCEYYNIRADSIEKRYSELRRIMEENIKKRSQKEALMKQLKEVQEEKTKFRLTFQSIERELEKLFQSAGAASEEEYRKIGMLKKEKEKIETELNWIEGQLRTKGLLTSSDMNDYQNERALKERETFLEEKEEELEKMKDSIRKKLAETEIEIRKIELSGLYSELKYSFEMKRSAAKKLAKKWAAMAVAREMLKHTTNYVRNEKMPKLLHKMEYFFRIATSGEYENIYLAEGSPSFSVKRKDGLVFTAEELSQGTAEQLYTAIRFALAESMQKRIHLPLMIDDSFVNFDHLRIKNIVSIMRQLSDHHQMLLFTCHQHILSYFQDEEIIYL